MHHLKDYKGFADASIELLQPFSLLIGPNGSGKSNVIEAIELLSFVFDPNPKLMRGYERVGDSILKRDGSNLSAVLYGLSTGDDDQRATLNRLLDAVSQLPDGPFVKFDFTRTDLRDVIFSLRERSGYTVDARVLSDGTLRTLAILTAFETVSEGSRIVVEEFDNGLHPSRVGVLSEAIARVAENRELKVLVTTHNPATMNFLTREQLKGVVLCTWDAEKAAASLVRLDNLARYDELLERGRLGDLVARRVIEQHLVPDFEERQRKKDVEWLEDVS